MFKVFVVVLLVVGLNGPPLTLVAGPGMEHECGCQQRVCVCPHPQKSQAPICHKTASPGVTLLEACGKVELPTGWVFFNILIPEPTIVFTNRLGLRLHLHRGDMPESPHSEPQPPPPQSA